MSRRGMTTAKTLVLAMAAAWVAPGALVAQGGDGYLFKQPRVTLEIETGYGFQQAKSEIFDFVIAEHTLGSSDFDAPYFGAELGLRVSERLDIALTVGWQESSQLSEFRDWVDQDDLPITQVTELRQVPATIGVKFYPFARGRSLGRYAWVPRRVAPFVGGSFGVVAYDFDQYGDFVDYETLDIFYSEFNSGAEAFLARASGGVNVSLGPQFLFSLEGRYSWADADMVGDYGQFGPIDLDGFQLIGGLAVRF